MTGVEFRTTINANSQMGTATTKLPAIQRPRPIDATGWFWSFVLLLAGLFYSQIFPVIGLLILLASPSCFVWQFKKWRDDFAIQQNAIAWCQEHYASFGDSPIGDLMVAIAHDTRRNICQLSPSTPLDDLNWITDDETKFNRHSPDRHRDWFDLIVGDARISRMNLSEFRGDTLHDAIMFVVIHTTTSVIGIQSPTGATRRRDRPQTPS